MADLFKSEWDFIKLFITLNAGSIAGWFVAEDRLVTSKVTGALFIVAILFFGVSMLLCLLATRILVHLEHTRLGKTITTPEGEKVYENTDFSNLFKRHHEYLNNALFLFFFGYVLAIVLIVLNLRSHHLPKW
jgi:Mg2+/citrate symporter